MNAAAHQALIRVEVLILINRDRNVTNGDIMIPIDPALRNKIKDALAELAKEAKA